MNTSAPDVLRTVTVLRVTSALLEGLVVLAVAGSALAVGSVHPWAYVPLWMTAALAVAFTGARATLVLSLRAKLGRSVITLHPARRWVTLETPGTQHQGWRFDLGRPLLGNTPLL